MWKNHRQFHERTKHLRDIYAERYADSLTGAAMPFITIIGPILRVLWASIWTIVRAIAKFFIWNECAIFAFKTD